MSGETVQLGLDCKMYLNTGSYDTPTWTEMKHIKDLSNPDGSEKVEASARYSDRKRFTPGMHEDQIDCGYQFVKGLNDVVLDAIVAAKKNRTLLDLKVADGDLNVNGTSWYRDVFMVEKLDRKEDLADVVMYDITFAPGVQFQSGSLVERTYGETSGL